MEAHERSAVEQLSDFGHLPLSPRFRFQCGIERRRESATASGHEQKRTDAEQQQETHISSKGGDRQRLRYIDGDISMCLRSKEVKTKEKEEKNGSSKVSRQVRCCDGRAAEEKKSMNSSSKGRNPTRVKEEPKDVRFIVLQKNTRVTESTSCSVKCRTASGM